MTAFDIDIPVPHDHMRLQSRVSTTTAASLYTRCVPVGFASFVRFSEITEIIDQALCTYIGEYMCPGGTVMLFSRQAAPAPNSPADVARWPAGRTSCS